MAGTITLKNGHKAVRCPSCKKYRIDTAFVKGDERCSYCRNGSTSIAALINKPVDAGWDDDSAEKCVCGGSGKYIHDFPNGDRFINICFRCAGKGWLSWRDLARNLTYDKHHPPLYSAR